MHAQSKVASGYIRLVDNPVLKWFGTSQLQILSAFVAFTLLLFHGVVSASVTEQVLHKGPGQRYALRTQDLRLKFTLVEESNRSCA